MSGSGRGRPLQPAAGPLCPLTWLPSPERAGAPTWSSVVAVTRSVIPVLVPHGYPVSSCTGKVAGVGPLRLSRYNSISDSLTSWLSLTLPRERSQTQQAMYCMVAFT